MCECVTKEKERKENERKHTNEMKSNFFLFPFFVLPYFKITMIIIIIDRGIIIMIMIINKIVKEHDKNYFYLNSFFGGSL